MLEILDFYVEEGTETYGQYTVALFAWSPQLFGSIANKKPQMFARS